MCGQHCIGDLLFALVAGLVRILVEVDDLHDLLLDFVIVRPLLLEGFEFAGRGQRGLDGVACFALLVAQRRREDSGHLVIIFGGDRVEFMVVATGAICGQAEESFCSDFDLVIDHVVTLEGQIFLGEGLFAQGEEARGHDAPVADAGLGISSKDVTGELLADKLVIRHVVIEGLYDIVAIAPCVRVSMIFVAAC